MKSQSYLPKQARGPVLKTCPQCHIIQTLYVYCKFQPLISLYNDSCQRSNYTVSNNSVIKNNERERIWKGKSLSWNFLGGGEVGL